MSKIYFKGTSDTRITPISGGAKDELSGEICVGSSSIYSYPIANFEVLRFENEDGTYDFTLNLDNLYSPMAFKFNDLILKYLLLTLFF